MDNESTDNNKTALHRSYSFSGSPITQKLCLEQSFQNKKGETLIRQYSCEQIYDISHAKPKIQFKESVFVHSPRKLKNIVPALDESSSSLFNTSYSTDKPSLNFQTVLERFPFTSSNINFFNFQKNCPEQEGFEKSLTHIRNINKEQLLDSVPMEVDTSIEDQSMTDVHFPCKMEEENEVSENEEHKSKVSKMIIPPNRLGNTNTTKNSSKTCKYLKLISKLFLIPVICAIIYENSNIFIGDKSYSSNRFDSNNITTALQNLLYGQQEVVHKLTESFHNIRDNNLIVFVGDVGVGKTYSANIISNNFPWQENIIKIIFPQYKNEYDKTSINSLSNNGYNLVIVDNLEFDNQSVIPFIKKIFGYSKKVILILIYTIPERSFDISKKSNVDIISSSKQISETLIEAKIKHTLITFNKLNADVVRKCIRYAMTKKGLTINQLNVEHILENINYEYSGCKGVYTKVALLG